MWSASLVICGPAPRLLKIYIALAATDEVEAEGSAAVAKSGVTSTAMSEFSNQVVWTLLINNYVGVWLGARCCPLAPRRETASSPIQWS